MHEFVKDPWNWFDALVVGITILSQFFSGIAVLLDEFAKAAAGAKGNSSGALQLYVPGNPDDRFQAYMSWGCACVYIKKTFACAYINMRKVLQLLHAALPSLAPCARFSAFRGSLLTSLPYIFNSPQPSNNQNKNS